MITGKDLIDWGFEPGPWFKAAIAEANRLRNDGLVEAQIRTKLDEFAPHGAGRNLSRTQFMRGVDTRESAFDRAQMTKLPSSIDARWFSGTSDVSEMPGAYKNAESVRRQIRTFGLAEIVDEVVPYGCIMAGEIDWRAAGKRLGDMA